MIVFTKDITVQNEHLDELNHVNNVVYLQWVQEIAKEHWLSKTNEAINSQYFWVVVSHHLEYRKQAFLGDHIIAKTYVSNFNGRFSERIVEFYRESKLLVEARSNWCLMGVDDLKPKRIPQEIERLFPLP